MQARPTDGDTSVDGGAADDLRLRSPGPDGGTSISRSPAEPGLAPHAAASGARSATGEDELLVSLDEVARASPSKFRAASPRGAAEGGAHHPGAATDTGSQHGSTATRAAAGGAALFSPMRPASLGDGRDGESVEGQPPTRRSSVWERKESTMDGRARMRGTLAGTALRRRETRQRARGRQVRAREAEFDRIPEEERVGKVWNRVLGQEAGTVVDVGGAQQSKWASWLRHDTHHPSHRIEEPARRRQDEAHRRAMARSKMSPKPRRRQGQPASHESKEEPAAEGGQTAAGSGATRPTSSSRVRLAKLRRSRSRAGRRGVSRPNSGAAHRSESPARSAARQASQASWGAVFEGKTEARQTETGNGQQQQQHW